jgi:PAS domain S-box-containing protein
VTAPSARRSGLVAATRRRLAHAASLVAPRYLAPGALVLAVTVAGLFVARGLAERDARRASDQRVEIAAAQLQSRLTAATSLTQSLQRFMTNEGSRGVTNAEFARNALQWLIPAELPAAAWAEQVKAPDRAAFEQRIRHAIVAPDSPHRTVPPASSYLPATLVSGFPPMNLLGIDLSREPGIVEILDRKKCDCSVGATPIRSHRGNTSGLFLVEPVPNLIDGVLHPGAVVLFVPEATLRAAAGDAAGLRLLTVNRSSRGDTGGDTVRAEFTVAGQRFEVVIPKEPVSGPGALLPWLILGAGLVLVALTGALGAYATRRAKAQADFDRIFNLSPDLIAVADFEGRFKRVNPAAERILGYTDQELHGRSWAEFVHPEDHEKTAAESAAVEQGQLMLSFENRYVRKNGLTRVLEWTAAAVVKEGLVYGVARDVTERRQAEIEQAALRRVATLTAEGIEPEQLLAVVAEEVALVLDVGVVSVERYDSHEASTVVASLKYPGFPVGTVWPLDAPSLGATIRDTREPARIDDYTGLDSTRAAAMRASGVNSAVGAPIVVDSRVWGVIFVGYRRGSSIPAGAEGRLARFADLVATAIARAESSAARERLGEEQAALRRVATLVAQGAEPQDLFEAVAKEVGGMLPVVSATMGRYEPDDSLTIVASWGTAEAAFPTGRRWPAEGMNVAWTVLQTGQSARVDDFSEATDPIGVATREAGTRCAVGSPIVVEGDLWGVMTATSSEGALPPDTESRLASFTELVATAIANAESKSELAASRRRIVAASDEARRRIERDLHDGVQQQLVALVIELRTMKSDPPARDTLTEQLAGVIDEMRSALDTLVEIARGIHPAILSQGGLAAALKTLAGRSAVPVQLHAEIEVSLPEVVQVAAYYVASEALTNVAKYAHASVVHIDVTTCDEILTLAVRDDGVGGADVSGGSGLIGLQDRVEALGGTITINSPAGKGTSIIVTLPITTKPDPDMADVLAPTQELGSRTARNE